MELRSLSEKFFQKVLDKLYIHIYDINLSAETHSAWSIWWNYGWTEIKAAWGKAGVAVSLAWSRDAGDYICYRDFSGKELTRYEAYRKAADFTGKRIKSKFLDNIGLD